MANVTNWDYTKAAHLLQRAGFGHSGLIVRMTGEASQVHQLAITTPDKAVDRMLSFRAIATQGQGTLNDDDDTSFNKLTYWWINQMRNTPMPVKEKMTLFLHGHFATTRAKVNRSLYHAKQNALFRFFSIGDFRELVKRVTIDMAMLWFLDGKLNKVGRPNENYGRELQELFTLGVFDFKGNPNYSQNDVVQAARILTGWRVSEDYRLRKIASYFTASRHDSDLATMYAPVANETPLQNPANQFNVQSTDPMAADYFAPEVAYQQLVNKIFDHVDTEGRPTVARFMARKLWKFFAYDPVVDYGTSRADLTLIDDLADVFKTNNYSLKELLRAMFLREEFYADATQTVTGPVEYVVGSLKKVRAKFGLPEQQAVGDRLKAMGQTLFNPPNVKGWPGNQAWINTQALLKRYQFARDLSDNDTGRYSQLGWNPVTYVDKLATTRQAVVDRFLKFLGPLTVDATTNDQLVAWLGAADTDLQLSDPNYLNVYVRGLVNLILTLPHYHVH